jgi:hypothetical protein
MKGMANRSKLERTNLVKSLCAKYSKIILELGMDDGRLLEKLAKQDKDDNSIYIGIEIDKQNYEIAKSRIKLEDNNNAVLSGKSFEEITDELLQPISDNEYNKWGEWLTTTFQSIGFELVDKKEDAPEEYQTRYIYRFKRNPKRIR